MLWWRIHSVDVCIYCCIRLTGRGQKTYMINVEAAKIAYKANDSNVKIYLEADSGVHKTSREFDRVSSVQFISDHSLH